jgi:outer membrane lipoprotein-sorting protein
MSVNTSSFYVTGGTLRLDTPSYVERQADHDLYDGLLKGEFCYVLTSRQMGKSSLMVRTANRLREKGAHVIVLDLTAIGQNLTPEQWYDGLIVRVGHQLHLEDELDDFWRDNERLSPVQRWVTAIREVAMVHRSGPLVIFVDEIDTVQSLPFSTDEFFSAIRECYNRRTEDAAFNRLTFCLLGVATPSDLIRDTRTTPFNIGRRVELNDFTAGEAAPLANGLGREQRVAGKLLERILHWTNGHPYLTQRLCQAIAQDLTATGPAGVDQRCEALFLSNRARERDDNLLFVRERILRSEADLAGLLSLYDQVRAGKRTRDDETNPFVRILRLSGIVRVAQGFLSVRNRVYHQVFDREWARANMPDQELRRQREAFRKGIIRGVLTGAIIALASLSLSWSARKQLETRASRRAQENLGAVYKGLTSYQDVAEIRQDFRMEGTKVTVSGSFILTMERPNKMNLTVRWRRGITELDAQLISDGTNFWVYRPDLKQYTVQPASGSLKSLLEQSRGPAETDLSQTLYGIIASDDPQAELAENGKSLKTLRKEAIDGTPSYVLTWDEAVRQKGASVSNGAAQNPPTKSMPVTVWAAVENGLIHQLSLDLSQLDISSSPLPNPNGGPPRTVKLQDFVTTTKHSAIRINPTLSKTIFVFRPPPEAQQVEAFNPTRGATSEVRGGDLRPEIDKARLPQLIPPRPPQSPLELIDLSGYYNAPLTEPWHSRRIGNDLSALPRGLQTLAGTAFDVRGIVQLAGRGESYLSSLYPKAVNEIKLGLKCRRLHFFQGAGWSAPDGTTIGQYLIHFADGQKRIVPIVYGFDVRNWWPQQGEPAESTGLVLAWTGTNEAIKSLNQSLRLYKTTWQNPLPEIEIKSVDFVSSMADPAPFLISITADSEK